MFSNSHDWSLCLVKLFCYGGTPDLFKVAIDQIAFRLLLLQKLLSFSLHVHRALEEVSNQSVFHYETQKFMISAW